MSTEYLCMWTECLGTWVLNICRYMSTEEKHKTWNEQRLARKQKAEMHSLWMTELYRLSIANKVRWLKVADSGIIVTFLLIFQVNDNVNNGDSVIGTSTVPSYIFVCQNCGMIIFKMIDQFIWALWLIWQYTSPNNCTTMFHACI